jgi:hypothetical protein
MSGNTDVIIFISEMFNTLLMKMWWVQTSGFWVNKLTNNGSAESGGPLCLRLLL